MNDNNIYLENVQFNFIEKSKTAVEFLNKLANETDIQLDIITLQQVELNNLLQEKEQERSTFESEKNENFNLFSPIHNKLYDSTQIDSEINSIGKKLEDINIELEVLKEKKSQLRNVFQCVEYIDKDLYKVCKENNRNYYIRNNDKGISLLETQENERQRIARDLHDTTVQNLTSLVWCWATRCSWPARPSAWPRSRSWPWPSAPGWRTGWSP
jgi:two-component system sensor histidine kinase DegS